jgi:hypothetical protein
MDKKDNAIMQTFWLVEILQEVCSFWFRLSLDCNIIHMSVFLVEQIKWVK